MLGHPGIAHVGTGQLPAVARTQGCRETLFGRGGTDWQRERLAGVIAGLGQRVLQRFAGGDVSGDVIEGGDFDQRRTRAGLAGATRAVDLVQGQRAGRRRSQQRPCQRYRAHQVQR